MTVITRCQQASVLLAIFLVWFCAGYRSLLAQSTNQTELPPALPVNPGGARVALAYTNGVPDPPKPKVRSTGKYGVVCPNCDLSQTNTPISLKCVGQVESGQNMVRDEYLGSFKCGSCGLEWSRNWYGKVRTETPVVEIMETVK